jgi:thymidylate synthase (FAD)
MKVVKQGIKNIYFHTMEGYTTTEQSLESIGRTCYKSEDRITPDSAPRFIEMLRERGHHAMLEHAFATVRYDMDRVTTQSLVRHRIASFAQESTRYCNYSKGKFGGEIMLIEQAEMSNEARTVYIEAAEKIEKAYMKLIELGCKPQTARAILPLGIKSEIVITANLREWMHIFELRCAKAAHPLIRELMKETLKVFAKRIPAMFEAQAEKFGVNMANEN